MKRIGLLGGSFNPAHRGHRRISLAALAALGLDEVWWLVSPGNPLKSEAKDMAPFEARLASARRMARRAPIRVSDFEARAGTRFTVDTLARLQQRYPQHRFIWLMGADTVAQFHQWKQWRTIARRVPIAVIARPVAAVRPTVAPGTQVDGLECTGDFAASPAARSYIRHRLTRARPQLAPPQTTAQVRSPDRRRAIYSQENTCPIVSQIVRTARPPATANR